MRGRVQRGWSRCVVRIGRLGSCGCVSWLGALRGVRSDVMRCVGLSQIDLRHHVPQERLIQSNFPSISKTCIYNCPCGIKQCQVVQCTASNRTVPLNKNAIYPGQMSKTRLTMSPKRQIPIEGFKSSCLILFTNFTLITTTAILLTICEVFERNL